MPPGVRARVRVAQEAAQTVTSLRLTEMQAATGAETPEEALHITAALRALKASPEARALVELMLQSIRYLRSRRQPAAPCAAAGAAGGCAAAGAAAASTAAPAAVVDAGELIWLIGRRID